MAIICSYRFRREHIQREKSNQRNEKESLRESSSLPMSTRACWADNLINHEALETSSSRNIDTSWSSKSSTMPRFRLINLIFILMAIHFRSLVNLDANFQTDFTVISRYYDKYSYFHSFFLLFTFFHTIA